MGIFPSRFYQCIFALIVSLFLAVCIPSLIGDLNVFLYLTIADLLFMAICVVICYSFSSKEARTIKKSPKGYGWGYCLSFFLFLFVYTLGNRFATAVLFPSEMSIMPITVALNSIFVAPIAEEVVYRGVFLRAMVQSERYPVWVSLVGVSFIFAIMHFPPSTPNHFNWFMQLGDVCNAFVLGCMLGMIYLYTGRIVFPIVAHGAVNLVGVCMIYFAHLFPSAFLVVGLCMCVIGILGFSRVSVKKHAAVFNNSAHL